MGRRGWVTREVFNFWEGLFLMVVMMKVPSCRDLCVCVCVRETRKRKTGERGQSLGALINLR